MLHFMPPTNHPRSSGSQVRPGPAENLHLLETWLAEACDWVCNLTRELTDVQEVIGLRFLEASESLLEEHRSVFRNLLPRLLELELDITGCGQRIEEFEALSQAYRELVTQLKQKH